MKITYTVEKTFNLDISKLVHTVIKQLLKEKDTVEGWNIYNQISDNPEHYLRKIGYPSDSPIDDYVLDDILEEVAKELAKRGYEI